MNAIKDITFKYCVFLHVFIFNIFWLLWISICFWEWSFFISILRKSEISGSPLVSSNTGGSELVGNFWSERCLHFVGKLVASSNMFFVCFYLAYFSKAQNKGVSKLTTLIRSALTPEIMRLWPQQIKIMNIERIESFKQRSNRWKS